LRRKEPFHNFVERLKRHWAIETGAIEGLYSLSEGATVTLIEKGLDAALIGHEDTDQPPEDVILKIKDQHQAIQGILQRVCEKYDREKAKKSQLTQQSIQVDPDSL
jgi:hypothetical protein